MSLEFQGGKREIVYSAILNNMANVSLNGVLSGCEVDTSTGTMKVDVESGRVFFGNDTINVSASTDTLTIDTESTSNTRKDLILVNTSGVLSILKGSASAVPATPDYDTSLYIALAIITITNSTTDITSDDIKDIRVLNQGGAGGDSGVMGRHIEEFTSQTSVTVTHNLGDDEPVVVVYNDSDVQVDPASVTITNKNELVVTFSTSTTGKIVVWGGAGVNNAYYEEEFTSSLTWSVNHKLDNQYVNVTCYNSSDEIIEPQTITMTDADNLSVEFGVATAGRVTVTGGSTKLELTKMTDVDISSPANGDALVYNSTTEKWENDVVNSSKIYEIYSGTAFDTLLSATTGTDEQSYEMTSISAADLGNADYLKIKMLVKYSVTGSGTSDVSIKIQTKDIGGSYSDSMIYQLLMRGNSENDTSEQYWTKEITWIHTLTNDEKTNGVQAKLFSKSTTDVASVVDVAVKNIQSTIENGFNN